MSMRIGGLAYTRPILSARVDLNEFMDGLALQLLEQRVAARLLWLPVLLPPVLPPQQVTVLRRSLHDMRCAGVVHTRSKDTFTPAAE